MKLKSALLLSAIALSFSAPCLTAASGAEGKTVQLIAYDTMKYNITKIEASPGQKITVELKSEGVAPKTVMAHNWILLTAGSDPVAYATSAMAAKAEDYQPKSLAKQVIASIRQLGPKETGKVTFTAPTKPGSYPFLCSFPAHVQAGMRGVLVVK